MRWTRWKYPDGARIPRGLQWVVPCGVVSGVATITASTLASSIERGAPGCRSAVQPLRDEAGSPFVMRLLDIGKIKRPAA
jgi:hypothetical protein